MTTTGLMRKVLGPQWQALPPALQAHHQETNNTDIGKLSVEFPTAMKPVLWLLRGLGALLHERGQALSTQVEKKVDAQGHQHWQRRVTLESRREMTFNSQWQFLEQQRLIEFVNPLLGLQMRVLFTDDRLHYRGEYLVLQLGPWRLRLPEALLGHTRIEEWALDEKYFAMDFRLTHPIFGQIYRYHGVFTTQKSAE